MVFVYSVFLSCTGNGVSTEAGPDAIYDDDRIYGQVDGLPGRKVLLFELYGDQINIIDSAMATSDGSFEFFFSGEREHGLYRIAMGKPGLPGHYGEHRQQIDLIWDGSTVVFRTHYEAPVDSMKIILSEENTGYYQLLKRVNEYYRKISVLSSALVHYPQDDNFYRRLERQFKRVQNRRSNYIDNLVKRNNGTIFPKIAAFYHMPRISSPAGNGSIEEIKEGFFTEGQFSDPVILRTDLLPEKIMRYLSLYQSADLDHEEQQEEMITAVDVILANAMENEEVYYYVLEYLINGFVHMNDMDLVTEHLTGHYLHGEVCFEEGRLLGTGSLPEWEPEEGEKVPGFSFTALDGSEVSLDDIDAEYTVLFFWGTWCPYCEDTMEGLHELYARYQKTDPGFLEVVAIGIEDDSAAWQDYIEAGEYHWINYSSFERWDCSIVRNYNLAGTPTMILLDGDKQFLQEPLRIRSLDRYLSRQMD